MPARKKSVPPQEPVSLREEIAIPLIRRHNGLIFCYFLSITESMRENFASRHCNVKPVSAPSVAERVLFQMCRNFCFGHADIVAFRNPATSNEENDYQNALNTANPDFFHIRSSILKSTVSLVIYHHVQGVATINQCFCLKRYFTGTGCNRKTQKKQRILTPGDSVISPSECDGRHPS